MENSIFEKKKRGRKPKDKPEASNVVTEKVHKKRGRRPKIKTTNEYDENENDKKYSLFKDDKNNLSVMLESCIIHLKVNNKDLLKIDKEDSKETQECNSYNIENNTADYKDYKVYNYKEHEKNNNSDTEDLYTIKFPVFNIKENNIKFIECMDNLIETSSEKNIIDIKLSQNNRKVRNLMDFFKNNWLEKSPYACWNCTEHFDSFPLGIPLNLNDDQRFNLYGNFCSFSCAARYLIENESGEIMHERMSLLNLFAKKCTNNKDYKIKPACSRLVLKKFGGVQSIDEYRSNNTTQYKEIHIYKPPLAPVLYLMEEYANHIKKDYKRPISPVHFDTNSFMNSYDKTRKNNINSVKDSIMRNFVGPSKEE